MILEVKNIKSEVKDEITIVLDLLKKLLIKNGVSMATDNKGNICFFDTDTYLKNEKMDGFKVNINDLVK